MADSFFDFDAALPPDEGPHGQEEDEYDALNDETFGDETDWREDDWERSHEKLASEITDTPSKGFPEKGNNFNQHHRPYDDDEEGLVSGSAAAQLEARLSEIILDDVESPAKQKPNLSMPPGFWPPIPTLQPPQLRENRGNFESVNGNSQMPIFNQYVMMGQNHPVQHQQMQPPQMAKPPQMMSVRTVEDLERDLRAKSQPTVHRAMIPGSNNFGSPGSRDSPKIGGPSPGGQVDSNQLLDMLRAISSLPGEHRPQGPPPELGLRHPHPPMPRGKMNFPHHPPPGPGGILPLPPGAMRHMHPPMHRMPPNMMPPRPGMPPNFHPRMRGEMPPFPWMNQQMPPMGMMHNHQQQQHMHHHHNQGMHHHHQQMMHHQHMQELQRQQQNGSHDPYSGLMTAKDKQWLINIQILQLNTQKPYVDDFYFTAFQFKQQQARERAGERGVRVQKREQRTLEPRHYTPAQFEGSLGKLQVVSVTAPRKIIDMEIMNAESSDSQTPVRDTKKVKQTLLELERLYMLVLQLEDLAHPLLEARQSVTESKDELVAKVLSTLTPPAGAEDKFPALLSIRKGKILLQRLFPHLTYSQQIPVWRSLMQNFWSVSRKDVQEQVLTDLFPPFREWNAQAVLPNLVELTTSMLPQPKSEGNTSPSNMTSRSPLPAALINKFGVSVITSIINRAGELDDSSCPPKTHPDWQDWSRFVSTVSEVASELSIEPSAPLDPLLKPNSLTRFVDNTQSQALQKLLQIDNKHAE